MTYKDRLTNNQSKLIRSLKQKKQRDVHNLFTVEGIKNIREFLNSDFELEYFISTNEENNLKIEESKNFVTSEKNFEKLSNWKSPQGTMGVFKKKTFNLQKDFNPSEKLTLVLDKVNDPGNFGTILRSCSWFGVPQIVCSPDTVEVFNPKVIQASMGGVAHVKVFYSPLFEFLESSEAKIIGADMEGTPLKNIKIPYPTILVLGNEANGISKNILKLLNEKICIPNSKKNSVESLNVGVAASVLMFWMI